MWFLLYCGEVKGSFGVVLYCGKYPFLVSSINKIAIFNWNELKPLPEGHEWRSWILPVHKHRGWITSDDNDRMGGSGKSSGLWYCVYFYGGRKSFWCRSPGNMAGVIWNISWVTSEWLRLSLFFASNSSGSRSSIQDNSFSVQRKPSWLN